MVEVNNPYYEYEVDVPEEGVELQQAIWQEGSDGRVDFLSNSSSVRIIVQADYAERLLHRIFDLIGPAVSCASFLMLAEARALPHQPGDNPDPFYEEAMSDLFSEYDSTRYFAGHRQRVGLMIHISFPRKLLPAVTACARWLAGGLKPDLSWSDFQPNHIEDARS